MRFLGIFVVCLLFFGCQKHEIDLIVFNAQVITMDDDLPEAQAFAVDHGKILFIGTNEEVFDLYESQNTLDGQAKTIMPGIIDAHAHFYQLGLGLQEADLRGTRSKEEVLQRISEFTPYNTASFIVARGWDQNDWADQSYPTKEDLDALFPDVPVALQRIDGHALWVNSKALVMAGIEGAGAVPGGMIMGDAFGRPNGILVDAPCDRVLELIPEPTVETSSIALKLAQDYCFSMGLTGVHDAGLRRPIIELIDRLQQDDVLRIKLDAMVANIEPDVSYYLAKGPTVKHRLRVGAIKVYADGALGSRGAALRAPYSDDPHHFGAIITPTNDLEALADRALASGFQLNTHAIGDSANVSVLRVYQKALAQTKNQRWRIEHAQVVPPDYFSAFSKNIIPSVQPTHATSDMYWVEDRLGADRMKGAYAYNSLLNQAGMLALGTDFPVEYVNPMLTLSSAVYRRDTSGFPESGFYSQEAITREQALKGMTLWAAYANFSESQRGSLIPGKDADFIVLNQNPLQCPDEMLSKIKVLKTFVDGQLVYAL
jgi:predicted amidohydrolase YtcJ